jgi:hypothetical protein
MYVIVNLFIYALVVQDAPLNSSNEDWVLMGGLLFQTMNHHCQMLQLRIRCLMGRLLLQFHLMNHHCPLYKLGPTMMISKLRV